MKKILTSITMIGLVAVFAFAATQAFFSDTETSTGNIFVAGSIDLKVDHAFASYNGIDCRTCSVIMISDESNMIVEKDDVAITPFAAVEAWVHPAWTAQNDPTLSAAGAKWIWPTNPTSLEDAQDGVIYTFEKKFTWMGPPTAGDLWFAVGSDNSVEVWLNGVKIGENLSEFGYKQESMLHIPAATVIAQIIQGENVLQFKVNNFARPGQDGIQNPGGLIYKFEINGNCQDDYFLNQCKLWQEKDLEDGDVFWKFDDVKPGDQGRNVISMHVYDNDAWACILTDMTDLENELTPPEAAAGDDTPDEGELSKYMNVFVWRTMTQDGEYNPPTDVGVYEGPFTDGFMDIAVPDDLPLTASTTYYYGLAWCFGAQSVDHGTGIITCDGSGDHNDAQTDILSVDLNFYAEQSRNNPDFSCSGLVDNEEAE